MTRFPAMIAFIAALAASSLAFAAGIHEPAKGSAERKAILDAIRPAIEAQMRGPVEFQINTMLSDGEWAFVGASPQRPGGGVHPRLGFGDQRGMNVGVLALHNQVGN